MRILALRIGTAFTPQAHSNVGHGDETLALLRHMSLQHDVLAVGRFGVNPGVKHHQIDFSAVKGSDPNTPHNVKAYQDAYQVCVEVVKEFNPDVIVTAIGSSGSQGMPDLNKSRTFAFCANYCGPVVALWNAFPELKRVCILNDPRCIIRLGDLNVWPDAVLSQANEDIQYRVFDRKMIRHYRYHKTQNWGLGPAIRDDGSQRSGIGILAHRHTEDSRLSKGRDLVWDFILSRCPGAVCRGRNWPDGPIPANDVNEWLKAFEWGPMIPIAENWITAKFGQYARAGCVPRPYSPRNEGALLIYDKHGLMIPLDHPIRWDASSNEYDRAWLEDAIKWTEPDFSSLDECLANLDKLPLYDVFGGYEDVK